MQERTYLWLVVMPLHLLLIAIIPFTSVEVNSIMYFLFGYVFIHGLGVNVGLHRWASHKATTVGPIAKWIMLFFSTVACQGPISWWARIHRSSHHKHSDTSMDMHSPVHGIWHSFIGWIYQRKASIPLKRCKDLLRDPVVRFFDSKCIPIIWGVWVGSALLSVDFLYFAIVIPTLLALYVENTINVICHLNFGYSSFDTKDRSRNVPILGFLGWGNGWHNNHHKYPSRFLFGIGRWEFDPCIIFTPFIKK